MVDLETAFANSMAYDAAFESAWRWFRRNKQGSVSLSEIVARVQAAISPPLPVPFARALYRIAAGRGLLSVMGTRAGPILG